MAPSITATMFRVQAGLGEARGKSKEEKNEANAVLRADMCSWPLGSQQSLREALGQPLFEEPNNGFDPPDSSGDKATPW